MGKNKELYTGTCSVDGSVKINGPFWILEETDRTYRYSGNNGIKTLRKRDTGCAISGRGPSLSAAVVCSSGSEAELQIRELFTDWFERAAARSFGTRAAEIGWNAAEEGLYPEMQQIPDDIAERKDWSAASRYISGAAGHSHSGFCLMCRKNGKSEIFYEERDGMRKMNIVACPCSSIDGHIFVPKDMGDKEAEDYAYRNFDKIRFKQTNRKK